MQKQQKSKGEKKTGRDSPKAKALPEKSVVISFRIPESAYEPYKEAIQKSGLPRSEFFRRLFDENINKVVISEKKIHTEDYNKYLHYVGKASNNLNQLAKLLNTAEKSGRVTKTQYLKGLNTLNSIRLLLLSKLGGRA